MACQSNASNVGRDFGIRGNGPYFALKHAGRLGIAPKGVINALKRNVDPFSMILAMVQKREMRQTQPCPGGYKIKGRRKKRVAIRDKRGLGALQKRRNELIERSMERLFGK